MIIDGYIVELVDNGEKYTNKADQLIDAQVFHVKRGDGVSGVAVGIVLVGWCLMAHHMFKGRRVCRPEIKKP